ncbi:MAG: glycosyltransferase [Bacilli bacterium]|nr:glycosyltransferase [Bacilli bacterium]
MEIIYLTSHLYEEDFDKAPKGAKLPNPAGQNFHGKLLKAFAKVEPTHAFCVLPNVYHHLGTKSFTSKDGVEYHYLVPPTNRYIRALFYPKMAAKKIAPLFQGRKCVVVFDSLSATLGTIAKTLSEKLSCPKIAILTDDINNITGVDASFAARIHKLVDDSDGAFSLTKGLLDCYQLSEKPHLIQPMLVEKEDVQPIKRNKPYIYYGGALFEKDGTKDLIDSFHSLKPNYDLVISGHGHFEPQVIEAAQANPRIHYLGQVSKKEHYAYIAGAALCINPRHYRKQLDDCAVPSKVMEYLCFGQCIASTTSTPIKESFGDNINWIEGPLESFFMAHLDEEKNLKDLIENKASTMIFEEFGISKTGWNIHQLLKKFN